MATDGFFGQRSERSAVKADIVAKYFWGWAKVLYKDARKRDQPLRYFDLYAGKGEYEDGTPSTPLLVLSRAIGDDSFRDLVEVHLSDIKPEYCQSLERAVRAVPRLHLLRDVPPVKSQAVDDTTTRRFEATKLPPTLSFVDPWGYKGLSLRLIRALTKDWGCDCIFFFNYNRINAGLNNPLVVEQMDDLFGKERAASLRGRIRGLTPQRREQAILDEIKDAIEDDGTRRSLAFTFKAESSNRTSHHLILVTKRSRPVGFEIMKNIMAKASSFAPQGVPTFVFDPAHRRLIPTPVTPAILQLSMFPQAKPERSPQPLELLGERLLAHFDDQTLTMAEVYREYTRVEERYLDRNVKDALRMLEASGRITVDPPVGSPDRRMRGGVATFADWVRVTFPPLSS